MTSASELRCSNSPASGSVAAKSTMVATRAASTAIDQFRMMVRGPRLVGICAVKHRDGSAEFVSEQHHVDTNIHVQLGRARYQGGNNPQVRTWIVPAHGFENRWSMLRPIRTKIGDKLLTQFVSTPDLAAGSAGISRQKSAAMRIAPAACTVHGSDIATHAIEHSSHRAVALAA